MSSYVDADKSLGQHWLEDEDSLNSICQAAGIELGDTVLEIGPGQGSLTAKLLELEAKVVAVEVDERLASGLQKRFVDRDFHLVIQSITKFDLGALPLGYKVVANIPYYLTGHLLQLLAETLNPPSLAVLLVQKEVAERVCAGAGSGSILSITTQYYFEVELGKVVPANLFSPPPKVDSQVLILKRKTAAPFTGVNDKELFRLVKAGFSSRRKTLLNALSGGLRLPKSDVELRLNRADISPNIRAQELDLGDWYKLYKVFEDTFSNNT